MKHTYVVILQSDIEENGYDENFNNVKSDIIQEITCCSHWWDFIRVIELPCEDSTKISQSND